jgi:hypothetical protein
MTDIFGAIKVADNLERAVIDTLRLWFPTYLREVELYQGQSIPRDALPMPRSFLVAEELDRENADQLPAIVVISPGLSGRQPLQEGDGTFRAAFSLAVGVFVGGLDRPTTKRLVRLYTAIARTIILQKQSLGGYADGTTWLDESYDDNLTFTDNETVGAGQAIFEVEVAGVVNRYGGPAAPFKPPPPPDPENQPGSNWPLVQKVTATVEIEE